MWLQFYDPTFDEKKKNMISKEMCQISFWTHTVTNEPYDLEAQAIFFCQIYIKHDVLLFFVYKKKHNFKFSEHYSDISYNRKGLNNRIGWQILQSE